MARILGEVGRYTSDQALKRHRRFLLTGLLSFSCLGIILGWNLRFWLPTGKLTTATAIVSDIILVAACIVLGIFALIKLETFERERRAMRKGAEGETKVAQILSDFPDDFRVIHGLSTPFGDLDHVVVGPTGIYIVDSKNWRGVVASDGKGELLLNGKPTDKSTVNPIVARTMDVRDRIRTLCGFEPPYFQVLLVFMSAWVEARWGTTGKALCVTDEHLRELIVESKTANKVDERQIDSVAQAFLALATMDKDFKR